MAVSADLLQRSYENGYRARQAGQPKVNPYRRTVGSRGQAVAYRPGPAERAMGAAWDDGWLTADAELATFERVAVEAGLVA